MSFRSQVIIILPYFFLTMFFSRGLLSGIIRYQLNTSAYKKRKKGMTFREWLFYSRYKEKVPKILRIYYYFVLLIHPTCLIICSLFFLIDIPINLGEIIAYCIYWFDTISIVAVYLPFCSFKSHLAYGRWIKKRGQKK